MTTEPIRTARLDGGRVINIRPTGPADTEALISLYERLSVADRQRRFFSGAVPPTSVVEDWVDVKNRRDGVGLVAELHIPNRKPVVIAEAGCARQADGDAELGIAVDPEHRGWLGSWLLDALLEQAALTGIPNVQALIESGNRSMRSVLCHRGAAGIPSADWSTARLTISTSGSTPSWPAGDGTARRRKRLLVESERHRWPGAATARAAGMDVLVCSGPDSKRRKCPLLTGEACPLVEGADVVIFDLQDGADAEAVAEAHSRQQTGPPVIHQQEHSAAAAKEAAEDAAKLTKDDDS